MDSFAGEVERSQKLRADTSRVRARSDRLIDDATRTCEDVLATRERMRDTRRMALETATHVVDEDIAASPVMTARLERLSKLVGRSPVIEEAKARLAEQYGISRGEAFELMLAISSHTNRKLRDVADRLVRGA